MRQQFLNELTTALPVHPVSVPVALRAGQIDGENTAKGVRVVLSDLLIGVTALELGYRVATANPRSRMVNVWDNPVAYHGYGGKLPACSFLQRQVEFATRRSAVEPAQLQQRIKQ